MNLKSTSGHLQRIGVFVAKSLYNKRFRSGDVTTTLPSLSHLDFWLINKIAAGEVVDPPLFAAPAGHLARRVGYRFRKLELRKLGKSLDSIPSAKMCPHGGLVAAGIDQLENSVALDGASFS